MKSLLIKWLVTLGVLGAAVICVFATQIGAITGRWLNGIDTGQPTLQDVDLPNIRAVKFLRPDQTVVNVAVSELHVISHGPGYATVGLTLTSQEPTALYPNLKIYLQSGQATVRTIVLPPNGYQHQANLTREQVSFTLTLRGGESGFTASAFYGSNGA